MRSSSMSIEAAQFVHPGLGVFHARMPWAKLRGKLGDFFERGCLLRAQIGQARRVQCRRQHAKIGARRAGASEQFEARARVIEPRARIAQLLIELLETLLVDILIPRAHEPVRGLVVLDLPLGGEQPVAHFAETGAERVRGLFGGFRLHGETHVVIRLSDAVRDSGRLFGAAARRRDLDDECAFGTTDHDALSESSLGVERALGVARRRRRASK